MDVAFASAFIISFGCVIGYHLYRDYASKDTDDMAPLQLPSPIFKGVTASYDNIEELAEPQLKEATAAAAVTEPPADLNQTVEEVAEAEAEPVGEAVAAVGYKNARDAQVIIHSRPLVRTTDIPLFEAEIVRGLRKHADTPRIIRTVLEAHKYGPITLEHLIDVVANSNVLRPAVPFRKAQKAEGIKGIRHELIWHLQRMSRLRAVSLDGM